MYFKQIRISILTLNLLLCAILTVSAQIQDQTKIYGRIVDTTETGIPYAAVQVLNQKDSTLCYGAISNEIGNFSIDGVKFGNYLIRISSVGFRTQYREVKISSQKKETYLKSFILSIDQVQLSVVEIKGKPSGYYNLPDKVDIYPDSAMLKSCVNALDLIDKLPEIKVDKRNDDVSILGNKNVLVLIDGMNNNRPLRFINPQDIEKIELITHPSAQYQSEIASVVNVILKDKKQEGMTLHLSFSVCPHQRDHFISSQIGYNIRKWQFFINYRAMFSKVIGADSTHRYDIDGVENLEYISHSVKNTDYFSTRHSIQYGFDFKPNKNDLISLTSQIYIHNSTSFSSREILLLNNNIPLKTSHNTANGNFGDNQNNYSFFYRHIFSKRNEITLSSNIFTLKEMEDFTFDDSTLYIASSEYSTSNRNEILKNNQISINSKAAYNQNFGDNLKTEAGLQFYVRKISSKNEAGANASTLDYRDMRTSLYENLIYSKNKFGLQAGLRFENLNVFLYDSIKNDVNKILPSINILYKLNTNSNISFNYNHKLKYPEYFLLNPYEFYSPDSLSLSSGNPNLLPENFHIFNTTFTYKKKKLTTSFSAVYKMASNFIEENKIIENEILYSKYENMGRANQIGFNSNISTILWKSITLDCFLSAEYTNYLNNSIHDGLAYSGDLTLNFPLPWDVDLDVSYTFFEKEINYNGYSIANSRFDEISLGKSFFDDNLTVSLLLWEPLIKSWEKNKNWSLSYTENNYYSTINHMSFLFDLSFSLNKGRKNERNKKESNLEEYERDLRHLSH